MDQTGDTLERFERIQDIQIGLLNDLDDKAQKTMRIAVLIFGLLFTATSIAIRNGETGLAPWNLSFGPKASFLIASLCLFGSLLFSIVTYFSSTVNYGIGGEFGYMVSRGSFSDQEYREIVLNSYSEAVEENEKVLDKNALRFRYALLFLFEAILFFLSGFNLAFLSGADLLPRILFGTVVVIFALVAAYLI